MFNKSDWLFLGAAFFSFLFSVSLWFGVGVQASKEAGVFVGLWVPSILALGNYVRQAALRPARGIRDGSRRIERARQRDDMVLVLTRIAPVLVERDPMHNAGVVPQSVDLGAPLPLKVLLRRSG